MVLTSRSAAMKQTTCYLSVSVCAKYKSYFKIEVFKNDGNNDDTKEVLINHFKHCYDLMIFTNNMDQQSSLRI
jgi:hypothetical protein